MFLECELLYLAYSSRGLSMGFMWEAFPSFIFPHWLSGNWHSDARVGALELFWDAQNKLYEVIFNFICTVSLLGQRVPVFWSYIYLVHYSTCLRFFFSLFCFSPSAFIFVVYWIVRFIKHPYLPYQTWFFWKDKCVCFLPLTLGQVSCPKIQLLSIINGIFLFLPRMPILYPSLYSIFI